MPSLYSRYLHAHNCLQARHLHSPTCTDKRECTRSWSREERFGGSSCTRVGSLQVACCALLSPATPNGRDLHSANLHSGDKSGDILLLSFESYWRCGIIMPGCCGGYSSQSSVISHQATLATQGIRGEPVLPSSERGASCCTMLGQGGRSRAGCVHSFADMGLPSPSLRHPPCRCL